MHAVSTGYLIMYVYTLCITEPRSFCLGSSGVISNDGLKTVSHLIVGSQAGRQKDLSRDFLGNFED